LWYLPYKKHLIGCKLFWKALTNLNAKPSTRQHLSTKGVQGVTYTERKLKLNLSVS
jgi:hypothetical protein